MNENDIYYINKLNDKDYKGTNKLNVYFIIFYLIEWMYDYYYVYYSIILVIKAYSKLHIYGLFL